jgi:hypothetical protein
MTREPFPWDNVMPPDIPQNAVNEWLAADSPEIRVTIETCIMNPVPVVVMAHPMAAGAAPSTLMPKLAVWFALAPTKEPV